MKETRQIWMIRATLNKNIATTSIVCQLCHEFGTSLWLNTNTYKLTLCSYSTYKQTERREQTLSSIFLWF